MTDWIDTTCPLTLASLAKDKFSWAPELEPERGSSLADIVGKTCIYWTKPSDNEIILVFSDATTLIMHHNQDCCEDVQIEDINGDFDDLLDTPLLVAEGRSQIDPTPKNDDSGTYTFYTFRTIKGSIDIRWYGSSNGYYSEEAETDIYMLRSGQSQHMMIQVTNKALALRSQRPN